jgi:hypothetical protein
MEWKRFYFFVLNTHIHTYHSRFIPKWIADTSRILRDAHVFPNDLAMRTADVTGDKPIVIQTQSMADVNAVGPLVAFYDIHERGELFFSVLNTHG